MSDFTPKQCIAAVAAHIKILESLKAENAKLREALEDAAEVICGEFCGTSHHDVCFDARKALKDTEWQK